MLAMPACFESAQGAEDYAESLSIPHRDFTAPKRQHVRLTQNTETRTRRSFRNMIGPEIVSELRIIAPESGADNQRGLGPRAERFRG
jgi:hypothetical protein